MNEETLREQYYDAIKNNEIGDIESTLEWVISKMAEQKKELVERVEKSIKVIGCSYFHKSIVLNNPHKAANLLLKRAGHKEHEDGARILALLGAIEEIKKPQ